jgi:hypothetical protein
MTFEEIPLREVPDHFFDPGEWKRLVDLCGGLQQALEQLSIPCLAYSAHPANLPPPSTTIANSLAQRFRTQLVQGEYIATGYDPEERCRMEFQPEDWDRYELNFAEDQAFAGKLKFTHIRVIRRDDRPESAKLLDEFVSWLRERQTQGESRRKVLEREAAKRFEPALTTRIFAAAYKAVFNKKRGRPRKEARE